MYLRRTATLAVLVWAVALGGATAAEHPCAPVVDDRLTALKIDRAKIGGIGYMPRVSANRRRSMVLGIDAWVELSSCRGSLVVKMRPNCTVQEVHTTGACTLDGLARP